MNTEPAFFCFATHKKGRIAPAFSYLMIVFQSDEFELLLDEELELPFDDELELPLEEEFELLFEDEFELEFELLFELEFELLFELELELLFELELELVFELELELPFEFELPSHFGPFFFGFFLKSTVTKSVVALSFADTSGAGIDLTPADAGMTRDTAATAVAARIAVNFLM